MSATWRCLLGREQKRACLADGGHCYEGDCPHGAYIPKGETVRHWRARMDKELNERRERERNEGQTAKEWGHEEGEDDD
jgi:hypothetical protein